MKIMVTGATGNVGREVVNLLLDEGETVVAITRNPATAGLPADAHMVAGDSSQPKTITSALSGVKAILVSPRAVGAATAELLSLAVEQGVERVVVLSAITVEYPVGERRFAEQFKAIEDAAKASGLHWTVLRNADFNSNSLAWAPQIRSAGVVRGAYGNAATSTIHERDIAAVAVRALTNSKRSGHSYVLTGPQSLTQYDRVRLIGEVIGKELIFEQISPEQVRKGMLAQGLPEEIPSRLLGSLADYAKQAGPSTTAVEEVLRRPALTFAEWAADHASAFRN
jgi:uncharacterized protein YbjT (DUF2867 family)